MTATLHTASPDDAHDSFVDDHDLPDDADLALEYDLMTATSGDDALSRRARRLRDRAAGAHPVLAQAYRRRACELEFVRFVLTSRGIAPDDLPLAS